MIDGILAEHSQAGAHTTDTINEKTEDAGVTVDGVKLKDSTVTTDTISCKSFSIRVNLTDSSTSCDCIAVFVTLDCFGSDASILNLLKAQTMLDKLIEVEELH